MRRSPAGTPFSWSSVDRGHYRLELTPSVRVDVEHRRSEPGAAEGWYYFGVPHVGGYRMSNVYSVEDALLEATEILQNLIDRRFPA